MKHKLAKEIIVKMEQSNKEFDVLLVKIKESSTHQEFEFYKKSFAQIMGTMLLDIVNPIVKEYPDLKPKGLK